MLTVAGLSVAYGGLQALTDVSLEVGDGEFVTIVGPNGAGKTTLMKTVSGAVTPTAGRIEFRGEDIAALPSHARARRGIAHVPEGRKVFPMQLAGRPFDEATVLRVGRAYEQATSWHTRRPPT
ncbi:MAG TPA: ATP-binding cassette domain-containing protein [Candidatus Limnocylindrales bacterium]|nr:ATP-binding cassette domain-containing protein [Candidatus Limnocylindrales bacterium]